METRILIGTKTKSGLSALWEDGGYFKDEGLCTIIANENGKKPNAAYVYMNNNKRQALIPVHVGFYVIKTTLKDGDFCHMIFRVVHAENELVEMKLVNFFEKGCWFKTLDPSLIDALKAAQNKVLCHNCIKVFYASWKHCKKKM